MAKIKVALVLGNTPSFDEDAFKYFILSVNKVQSTFEFAFPYLEAYPFSDELCVYKNATKVFEKYVKKNDVVADHSVAIISTAFDNNFYSDSSDDASVITCDTWEKLFSPPSLFEHLLHNIISCLIYSTQRTKERNHGSDEREFEIGSHDDTRGCVGDFTAYKKDQKADILIGYICEQHQKEIGLYYGKKYLDDVVLILDRKWIGTINEAGSVAYNLKHAYKFDINKDSGFNKTFWEKAQDKFYDIPGDITGEVLKVILTAIVTYLLIRYGIMTQS